MDDAPDVGEGLLNVMGHMVHFTDVVIIHPANTLIRQSKLLIQE